MRFLLLTMMTGSMISTAPAAMLIVDAAPAPGEAGAAGMHTFTLSLLTEGSEIFRGVDANFTGAMNQVNPLGLPTIFNDNNVVMNALMLTPLADSQFLFSSTSVLSIGVAESANQLKGAMSGIADNGLPNPAPFAQIVALPGSVQYNLSFDVGLPQPYTVSSILLLPNVPFPEPTTCVLAGLALIGAAGRHRV